MEYTKERPLKVVTLCSGYDSQCLALNRIKQNYSDFEYELIAWAEVDKYAIQAHNVLFPQYADRNMGDITSCDWSAIKSDVDLLVYSTPCQSISSAGKQEGLKEGSGTASSIIWSVLHAIDTLNPKYLLMENVKALVSNKFIGDFRQWQGELAKRGYTNFIKVLDAQNYGVPQHRERVFMVSILGDNASFHFPEPFPLDKRLKDVLEEGVDEKYYLSKKIIDTFIERNKINEDKGNGFKFEPTDGDCVASSGLTTPGSRPYDNYIKEPIACAMRGREVQCLTPKRTEYGKKVRNEYESGELKESRHNMQQLEPREDGGCNTITSVQKDCLIIEPKILSYTRDTNGKVVDRHLKDVANTIHGGTGGGGNTDSFVFEPKIIEVEKKVEEMVNKSRSVKCGVSISKDNRIVAFQYDKKRSSVSEYKIDNDEGISQTVISAHEPKVYGESTEYRIRKLTERECFRLMDVDDEDIDKIQAAGISKSQRYKLAGNSICVGVLFHIFRKLFIDTSCESKQLSLF